MKIVLAGNSSTLSKTENDSFHSQTLLRLFLLQISSAACGYGFTLIASSTKDVTKLWGMGLNKDSQLGFQRTQQSRRKKNDGYDHVGREKAIR